MRALRLERFGPVTDLKTSEVPVPTPAPGEVRVAIRAAAVSPFDVKSVTGLIPLTQLPRVPGRDYAGVVVEGPPALIGREVWGTGGTLGLTRDGGHAEYLVVPADAVRDKPRTLDFAQAAGVGVSYLAAWLGLMRAAQVAAGQVVLIVGAAGSVGRAAAQIARWRGARVIGADRSPSHDGSVDVVVNTATEDLAKAVRELTQGAGVDIAFDTVGGPAFEATLRSVRHRGRHVVISSVGERRVSFDLLDFYHDELTLQGIDTVKYDPRASAELLDELRPGFDAGALHPFATVTFPLAAGAAAYQAVAAGAGGAKVILVP